MAAPLAARTKDELCNLYQLFELPFRTDVSGSSFTGGPDGQNKHGKEGFRGDGPGEAAGNRQQRRQGQSWRRSPPVEQPAVCARLTFGSAETFHLVVTFRLRNAWGLPALLAGGLSQ